MLKEYTWRKIRAAKLMNIKKALEEQKKKQKRSSNANEEPFSSPDLYGVTVLSKAQLPPDDG